MWLGLCYVAVLVVFCAQMQVSGCGFGGAANAMRGSGCERLETDVLRSVQCVCCCCFRSVPMFRCDDISCLNVSLECGRFTALRVRLVPRLVSVAGV